MQHFAAIECWIVPLRCCRADGRAVGRAYGCDVVLARLRSAPLVLGLWPLFVITPLGWRRCCTVGFGFWSLSRVPVRTSREKTSAYLPVRIWHSNYACCIKNTQKTIALFCQLISVYTVNYFSNVVVSLNYHCMLQFSSQYFASLATHLTYNFQSAFFLFSTYQSFKITMCLSVQFCLSHIYLTISKLKSVYFFFSYLLSVLSVFKHLIFLSLYFQ